MKTARIPLFAATCYGLNHQVIPCSHLATLGLEWGLGIFLFILLIVIGATIFWLSMLIHALTHDIPNKFMWVVVILFTHVLGAILYYRIVRRHMSARVSA